jgi:Cft2 family RNA processing exonuclease
VDIFYNRGLQIPELDLWLDPHRSRDVAVISHAHSDHVRRHRTTYVTAPTAHLLNHTGKGGSKTVALEYGQRTPYGRGHLTLLPAGHILGSAQVLVEAGDHRLLYSGDLKLEPGLTAEPVSIPHADTLVMESTYARPHYRFPPAEEVLGRIEAFCRQALRNGETPILYAYPLGKSQDVLAALGSADLPMAVHPSIAAVSAIYEHCGVRLPSYDVIKPGDDGGRVLIVPPQTRGSDFLAGIERRRTACVTGWALDRGATYRFRCDEAFPLSDHAGYPDLLEYVERVAPACIYTVHGFARELARDLRQRGHRAYALSQPDQLPLF